MAYFKFFPEIFYDVRGINNNENFDRVTDIFKRVLLKSNSWKKPEDNESDVMEAANGFERYLIRDGDRPETLAHQFYGDSELHWIILYANGGNLLNPYKDWPKTQFDLKKFVEKKYGASKINDPKHYEDADGNEVPQGGTIIIPISEGGDDVGNRAPSSTIVTNFLYEERLNDAKRNIRVLEAQYVDLVVDEVQRLLKGF